jgi:hypothetical protein
MIMAILSGIFNFLSLVIKGCKNIAVKKATIIGTIKAAIICVIKRKTIKERPIRIINIFRKKYLLVCFI